MRDLAWWDTTAQTLKWTFAKTMSEHPHRYVVRGQQLSDDDFEAAVRVIRRHGEPGKFYKTTLIYLTHNGKRFWTMGEPINRCRIINVSDDVWYGEQDAPATFSGIVTVYDDLAPDYDARYRTATCQAENTAIRQHITSVLPRGPRPTTLDVGAGTGLALDLRITTPAKYTGVDPSQAMLNELVRKHRSVRNLHPTRFTAGFPLDGFDLVTALFGAASYLDPDAIASIPKRLAPGGRAVLMLYSPGYWPDYYCSEPPTAGPAFDAALDLDGELMDLANYTVVTV